MTILGGDHVIKTNLPVILLRNMLLLPNNELRFEFDQDETKNILDVAELFHENKLLVVSSEDSLEEMPDLEGLPNVGVIAVIESKMELPNDKTRVVIRGLERAHIIEYLNITRTKEVLEAIVQKEEEEEISEDKNRILVHKLLTELESYLKKIPYMSNSMMASIRKEKQLPIVTDMIAPHLPISTERYYEYLGEFKAVIRAEMILKDLYEQEHIFEVEKEIDQRVRKEVDQHQKEFLLRERMKVIQEELGEEEFSKTEVDRFLEKEKKLRLPKKVKERLDSEIHRYKSLPPMSPEVNMIHTYIDWILDLPWGKYSEDCKDFSFVQDKLNESHAGLSKIKERIIEFLAVRQMAGKMSGSIICFVGPPGVGKTSLAFSIAKAMKREFVKISVGGVSDESEIMGHRRTYIGAMPGRIIQAMKRSHTNNPVFLIDEIDKMTKSIHGDPASCFLEILDPEQNKMFRDNYIEEAYDLSNVLFILTANDIDEIPDPLRDRLEIIMLDGYTEYEKLDIAKNYLIPKLCRTHGLKQKQVEISDREILYMIRYYTKEAGVRELERQLEKVLRKIVTKIVVAHEKKRVYHISHQDLLHYLGKEKFQYMKRGKNVPGVVNGLAYTSYGGDTLPIEVNYYKGNGNLVLTGCLGDVMKESATIALSYIKSNAEMLHIPYNMLVENDIHIHVPEGAIPKDGPSAGITLVTALYSAFQKLKVERTIAMTGEITLQGQVLPVGGIKEKSLGAARQGIRTILLPQENLKDLDEVPAEIKKKIRYIPVKYYVDVLKYLKEGKEYDFARNR